MKRIPRVHYFFRKPRLGDYSIERVFTKIIEELPKESFHVRCLISPFLSKGIIRRLLLICWAAANQGDINHITGDIHFASILMRRQRTVLTIHDSASLRRLKGWRRRIYEIFWLQLPLRRAGWVTVISTASQREIVSYIKNNMKIRIIPDCTTLGVSSIGSDFNKGKPMILQIGTRDNKNLERLAQALDGISCELRIIGHLSSSQVNHLRKLKLYWTNVFDISDQELRNEFMRADIVSFISLYEGFGLPILEAQACFKPVLTSDREPMRSIAGGGAVFVNPENIAEIRSGLLKLICDDTARRQVIAIGQKNVGAYAPSIVAASYISLYREICQKVWSD